MDVKFFDGLFEGDSVNGVKLCLGLTGGDFWARIGGALVCREVKEVQCSSRADISVVFDVCAVRAAVRIFDTPVPGEVYNFGLSTVSGDGVERFLEHALCFAKFADNGSFTPNYCGAVDCLSSRLVDGDVVLRWSHYGSVPADQPDSFEVYNAQAGGDLSQLASAATLEYAGPGNYYCKVEYVQGMSHLCVVPVKNGQISGPVRSVHVPVPENTPSALLNCRVTKI